VKILDIIKHRIAILTLQKELNNHHRVAAFNNFESATTVGFIFNADDKEKYQLTRDFMDFVEKQNNRIFGIGFAKKSDQIAYFPVKQGIDYFGLDEVNWIGKPTNQAIGDFLKRNFDILIDLSLNDDYQTEYIFALSIAKFKIVNSSKKSKYGDFIIEIQNSEKLNLYIEQIKHYLKVIQGKTTPA
jgi:hypothetical protein